MAADPGAAGLAFLKVGASAKATAMGQAGEALIGDFDSVYLNPAVLGEIWQRQAMFHYANLYEDVNHSHIEYVHPTLSYGVWAGRLEYLSYGSIANYDATGAKTGSSNPSDLLASLSWGTSLSNRLSIGATAKYIEESLTPVSAKAFAADIGAAYPLAPFLKNKNISLGFAIRNLGPAARFENAQEKLPTDISWGLAYISPLDTLSLAMDFHRASDRPEALYLNIGGEYWIKDLLALRAGYTTLNDIGPGINGGFGLKVDNIELNYSFSPFSTLGNVHRIGVTMRFGGNLAEKLYQQGLPAAAATPEKALNLYDALSGQ